VTQEKRCQKKGARHQFVPGTFFFFSFFSFFVTFIAFIRAAVLDFENRKIFFENLDKLFLKWYHSIA